MPKSKLLQALADEADEEVSNQKSKATTKTKTKRRRGKKKDRENEAIKERMTALAKPKKDEPERWRKTKLKKIKAPSHFTSIFTAYGNRAIIMDTMDNDWNDLICYLPHMQMAHHLKRNDLRPKDQVKFVCEHLQKIYNR